MNIVYLILGTNLGDREKNFIHTKAKLTSTCGNIIKQSLIYQTAPWGKTNQPNFLNQVIILKTLLGAQALLQALLQIETDMGRIRMDKYGERIIDIDILFYNGDIIHSENLIIPHPHLHKRKFVLIPLAEIVPNKIHPVFKVSVKKLLQNCIDDLEVKEFI
jgi:2-amino-4-hydroxy-6-hydroxymethyldihydropteridine diphosphokinase